MHPLIKLCRPHQYVKNCFVLVGPLFAQQWDAATLVDAGTAFLAFCMMASTVYVLNDLIDIAADRAHPVKRNRPIASGQVSKATAIRLALCLGALSAGLATMVGLPVLLCVATYLLLNVLYAVKLKHVVILDVFIISSGFMLRLLAGTVGLGIAPSAWLILCGVMITLFLGFSKRLAELKTLDAQQNSDQQLIRRALDDYSSGMLEQFIAITAACTILSFGLYTVSPQTVALHNSENLIYTLPFVMYGVFRYLFLLYSRSRGADAARDLLTDRHLLITVTAWFSITAWILS